MVWCSISVFADGHDGKIPQWKSKSSRILILADDLEWKLLLFIAEYLEKEKPALKYSSGIQTGNQSSIQDRPEV
jgi:hypothetical protein